MYKSLKSEIGLLLTVIIWATSFIASDYLLKHMTTFQLLFYRFTIASVIMLAITAAKKIKIDKKTLWSGILLGIFLFFGFALQTYGLSMSTPGKNAFLTGLYVVIVPFISFVIYRRKTEKRQIIAVFISIIGAAVLSVEPDFSVNLGDMLTIASAVFYALQIFYAAEYSRKVNVVALTAVQMVVCAVLSTVMAAATGKLDFTPVNSTTLPYILHAGIICTALCFFLQMYFQKRLSETQATIIFTTEGTFSALFSVLLQIEPLTVRLVIGSSFMFFAAIYSQLKPRTSNAGQMPLDESCLSEE